jgi:ATP-dependent helicase/nuclease subunit A
LRGIAERAAATLSDEIPGIGRVRGWEQSLVAALDGLARARAWFDSEPPDVFAERLRRLLAFEATESARHLGAYRIANLDRLLRSLALALEASGGDVAALLAELRGAVAEAREEEEGRPRDATENAVHVLTIHKAKGLDFRHVYLLQHHKEGGRGAEAEPAGVALLEDGAEYWLLKPSAATLGWAERVLGRDQVADAERVRTLYVAMTRAKDRLVLSGSWPTPGGGVRRTHAALLLARDPEPPDLAALAARVASGADEVDAAGARWVFPALVAGDEEPDARRPGEAGLPSAADVERESARLLAACELARAREARPFAAAASASAEKTEDDELLARRYGDASEERGGTVAPELARAVGTAVHRALELLDPTLDPEDALRACGERARGTLSLLVGPDELETALARVGEVLERFVRGPLFTRLRKLAPHVVARELPVLLRPEDPDTGPVGFVAGAIDLVHRDPATGELVVVDYKTDRIETKAEIAERTRGYAAQGAEYQRALREALRLDAPPRFELWFLYAGAVVPVG